MSDDERANASVFRTARAHLEAARDAVRRAPGDDATIELLRRLNAELPRSVMVQRLLIETHLRRGALPDADRVLAEALLMRPAHRALVLLKAKCHMLRGHWRAAGEELHKRLQEFPADSEAHELAGEAASADGDHHLAAGHFAMAAAHARQRTRRRALIARAKLEANELEEAAQWLADVGRPCPRLTGRLAQQRGQWLDAADQLTRAATDTDLDPLARQLRLRELIEIRRQLAEPQSLRAVIDRITFDQPLACAAAATALLTLGEFHRAAAMMLQLVRRCPRHVLGWHVLTVAAALGGRPRLASRSLGRSARHGVRIEPALMARLWRTGLLSKLLLQQRDARQCGSDPDSRLLTPLLRKAVSVFDRQLRADGRPASSMNRTVLSEPRRQRLIQHRSACLAALGEPVAALYGLERTRWHNHSVRAAA